MLLVSCTDRAGQAPPDPRLVRLKDAIDDAAARGYVQEGYSVGVCVHFRESIL